MVRGGGARRDERPGDGRIEHTRHREVIKTADWVLDLGPEGGEVVAEGTPEQVAAEPRSYTGGYLKELLAKSVRAEARPGPGRKKDENWGQYTFRVEIAVPGTCLAPCILPWNRRKVGYCPTRSRRARRRSVPRLRDRQAFGPRRFKPKFDSDLHFRGGFGRRGAVRRAAWKIGNGGDPASLRASQKRLMW